MFNVVCCENYGMRELNEQSQSLVSTGVCTNRTKVEKKMGHEKRGVCVCACVCVCVCAFF